MSPVRAIRFFRIQWTIVLLLEMALSLGILRSGIRALLFIVTGDGKAVEVRRRKGKKDTDNPKKAAQAAEAELEELWEQAIKYRLTNDREVASMRRNIDRGRYTVGHYMKNWRCVQTLQYSGTHAGV